MGKLLIPLACCMLVPREQRTISLWNMFSSHGAVRGAMGWEGERWLWSLVPMSRPLARSRCWADPGFRQVCAQGLRSRCFYWERSAACVQLVNACTPYFREFLLGVPVWGLLAVYVSSCLPLWVLLPADGCDGGPKFINTGCVKGQQNPQTKKRGGGEEGAKRADACNILCI